MKKYIRKILCLLLGLSVLGGTFTTANAVDCWPNWSGDWVVEGNCTWPGNYKVYGDIIVGPYTITIPTGGIIGIDLVIKKATFTTGKMLFQGTAKMDNSVYTRYYQTHSYSHKGSNSGCDAACTPCPSGSSVMNASSNGEQSSTPRAVPPNGNMRCAKF